MSNYKIHKEAWKECTDCELHKQRTKVVMARGVIPCEVLFIGEAPGVSEDIIGRPFVGPAGKLLDDIIKRAKVFSDYNFSFAMTNLVGCIPRDEKGNKTKEPSLDTIKACEDRLGEWIELCNPKAIVTVGKLATKHVGCWDNKIKRLSIVHPAAILRADISQRGLVIQRSVIDIASVALELLGVKQQ